MTKEIKFGDIEADDESLFVSKEISIYGKKVNTPIKSVDLTKTSPHFPLNENIKGINEVHRKVLQERRIDTNGQIMRYSITDMIQNPALQDQFNYRLNGLFKKADEKEVSITLLEYEGGSFPSGKTLGFILDTIYEYSDITTMPIITGLRDRISNDEEFKHYVDFLKDCLKLVEEINNKPIMGIVPPIAYYFIEDLIKFYKEVGINAFCFDFDGKNPITMRQTIREFLKALKRNDLLEESFVHCINVNPGRFNKGVDVVGAKDILSFGVGFDCLGDKHKPLKRPKSFYDELKNSTENRFRIFNKNDYGYHKVNLDNIGGVLPEDTSFSEASFSSDPLLIQKLFNTEQQGLEAVRLRGIITDGTPKKYLADKKQVPPDDFKKIIKMKKDISR